MTQGNITVGITGAAGLLGRQCAKLLSGQGYKVIGLYRNTKPPELDIEWIQGDILDIMLMESFVSECDIVVHCAAEVNHNQKSNNHLYKINSKGK